MSSFILDYFNYRIVAQYLDRFAEGLGNTLIATGVSFVLSFVLGTIMAIIMFTQWKVLRHFIQAYVTFIRSTPLLVQIYLVYFGLPVLLPFTAKWPEMWLGIAALVINCTPYMSEIIRTGIGSVPRGQVEAAKAVGMSYGQRLIHIVLPQAFANVIPPVLGQTAVLIKDTSLLSLITVFEFTSAGLLLNSERVRPNESFLTIAAGYLAIYCVMLFLSHQVKKKLAGPAWAAKG
ncbi:amino acid ABC transporter permease [Pseudochrobactrum sp. sp1633]|uniref:amino acid ABC transporter permease n=1 Tax=Pseudochrobactrum sp. sp1633 TaxID=3036706 RepID=UPI0025A50FA5|nr:amino acid ABC transporter permease [Pseudochrobactrum sp. sp1633]MDM8345852.1 amino acid ABC transporter permease [Pseudochrobactrum sp. sp1633]HWD12290.1 amino acid ABC transporter permease [Pseudochrobactrum sp.]